MPVTVSDMRAMEIEARLAPLFTRSNYIHDQLTQKNGTQERHVITGIAAMSVHVDDGTDRPPQPFTPDNLVLDRDRRLFSNQQLDALDMDLNLEGAWDDETARQTVVNVRNRLDEDIARHLMSASTTPISDGATVLSKESVRTAKARLMAQDGAGTPVVFAHPFATAAMDTIDSFTPNYQAAERGDLGIPSVGTIYGMRVFETNSVPNPTNHRIASTAWTAATGTLTVTLAETDASAHGFRVGQRVTFDTATAAGDMATPTAITGVSGGTITIASSGVADGTATEVGALILADAAALVVDRAHAYAAILRRPRVRFVGDPDSSNTSLQVTAHFGRVARPGRVECLFTNATAITTA